jgi:hypothetical protein
VLSSSLTTFQGFPAAEYVIAVDGGIYDKGLLVLTHAPVYQLQAIEKSNPPRGYDHFKSSFHIAAPVSPRAEPGGQYSFLITK